MLYYVHMDYDDIIINQSKYSKEQVVQAIQEALKNPTLITKKTAQYLIDFLEDLKKEEKQQLIKKLNSL